MPLTHKVRYLHYLALSVYFALFALIMAWNCVLVPSVRFPIAMALIVMLTPLLLHLRGFLHGRPKSCAWMAYISLLYIIHGIVEAYVNAPERLYAVTEAVLALILFFSVTFYLRLFNVS